MTANPTDKPRLPEDPQEIEDFNITTPITSTKELIDTARTLRQTYYFYRIPDTWIDIPENTNQTDTQNIDQEDNKEKNLPKPAIPNSLTEVQNYLTTKKVDLTQTPIPITQQTKAKDTLELLRQHFTINSIPENLLALPPLPEPNWEIFSPKFQ